MTRTSKTQSATPKSAAVRSPAAAAAAAAARKSIRVAPPKSARPRSSGVPAPTAAIAEASGRALERAGTAATIIRPEPSPAHEAAAPTTKTARLLALLQSEAGASITDIVIAFGWLPHTSRAALTGLRKREHAIERRSLDGSTRYRIADGEKA